MPWSREVADTVPAGPRVRMPNATRARKRPRGVFAIMVVPPLAGVRLWRAQPEPGQRSLVFEDAPAGVLDGDGDLSVAALVDDRVGVRRASGAGCAAVR